MIAPQKRKCMMKNVRNIGVWRDEKLKEKDTEIPWKEIPKKIPKTTATLVALHNLGAVDEAHAVTKEELDKEFDKVSKQQRRK
jgi:hypothetical protein